MLLTTHALTGGLIGQAIGNAPLGFILAFGSHFLLDKIPHFDAGVWNEKDSDSWGTKVWLFVIADIVVILVLLVFLLPKSTYFPFIAGAIGGALMDIITNVPWWKKPLLKTKWGAWLSKIHNQIHFPKSKFVAQHTWLMLGAQIILIGLILWLIQL